MKLKLSGLYASLILCTIFLFAGCNNTTTSLYRSSDYNYNQSKSYDTKHNSGNTVGKFFKWENGIVTNDRYQNYSDMSRPAL